MKKVKQSRICNILHKYTASILKQHDSWVKSHSDLMSHWPIKMYSLGKVSYPSIKIHFHDFSDHLWVIQSFISLQITSINLDFSSSIKKLECPVLCHTQNCKLKVKLPLHLSLKGDLLSLAQLFCYLLLVISDHSRVGWCKVKRAWK